MIKIETFIILYLVFYFPSVIVVQVTASESLSRCTLTPIPKWCFIIPLNNIYNASSIFHFIYFILLFHDCSLLLYSERISCICYFGSIYLLGLISQSSGNAFNNKPYQSGKRHYLYLDPISQSLFWWYWQSPTWCPSKTLIR